MPTFSTLVNLLILMLRPFFLMFAPCARDILFVGGIAIVQLLRPLYPPPPYAIPHSYRFFKFILPDFPSTRGNLYCQPPDYSPR